MRISILLAVVAICGVAAGLAASRRDVARLWLSNRELVGPPPASDPRMPPVAPKENPQPRAEVDEERFNYGPMERGSKLSHTFKIHNRGAAPLLLTKGDTTCKCTLSGLNKAELAPGETADVTLQWKVDTDRRWFEQGADIYTNDPNRRAIHFSVVGKVVRSIEIEPETVAISKVAGDTRVYEVRVASAKFDDLRLTGFSLDDPQTALSYAVAIRPLTPEELRSPPLDELELKSGAMVQLTVKPGLPQGPIRQTILLDTNLSSFPRVNIPIRGKIESDISIPGGQGWNESAGVLAIGSVPSAQGAQRQLKLYVRGPHRQEVAFEVASTLPDVLKVRLGQPTDGRVRQVPLTIEIAPGSRPMTHLGRDHGGFGEVVLKTTHPEVPEFRFRVTFAVTD